MASHSSFFFLAATASLLALADRAAAQLEVDADQASGLGPGVTLTEPFTENAAAVEMADPGAPPQILEQQDIVATRLFSRTCPCVPRTDAELVRPSSGCLGAYLPGSYKRVKGRSHTVEKRKTCPVHAHAAAHLHNDWSSGRRTR